MGDDSKVFRHFTGDPPDAEPVTWAPGDDHIALSVDDVDAACVDLRALVIEPVAGPRDFYWGRSAYFRDPGGRLVELHKSSRGASEP